jgi:hypothetical protein
MDNHEHFAANTQKQYGYLEDKVESEFLQQRAHREQSSARGQIPTVEIIRRGRADFIGFWGDPLQGLIYGDFVVVLSSVCNHLGDLLGVGFAKWLLRKLLSLPQY